jgi:hypothetical protein
MTARQDGEKEEEKRMACKQALVWIHPLSDKVHVGRRNLVDT